MNNEILENLLKYIISETNENKKITLESILEIFPNIKTTNEVQEILNQSEDIKIENNYIYYNKINDTEDEIELQIYENMKITEINISKNNNLKTLLEEENKIKKLIEEHNKRIENQYKIQPITYIKNLTKEGNFSKLDEDEITSEDFILINDNNQKEYLLFKTSEKFGNSYILISFETINLEKFKNIKNNYFKHILDEQFINLTIYGEIDNELKIELNNYSKINIPYNKNITKIIEPIKEINLILKTINKEGE